MSLKLSQFQLLVRVPNFDASEPESESPHHAQLSGRKKYESVPPLVVTLAIGQCQFAALLERSWNEHVAVWPLLTRTYSENTVLNAVERSVAPSRVVEVFEIDAVPLAVFPEYEKSI